MGNRLSPSSSSSSPNQIFPSSPNSNAVPDVFIDEHRNTILNVARLSKARIAGRSQRNLLASPSSQHTSATGRSLGRGNTLRSPDSKDVPLSPLPVKSPPPDPFHRQDVPLPSDFVWTPLLHRIADHWNLKNSELTHFWFYFQSLDTDRSGTIEQVEFFLFLKEARTRVLNYILPIIVINEMDQLHFSAWMSAIFGFCFLTEREVIEHIFARYDSTRSGKLLANDLFKIIKHIHADNPLFPKDAVISLSDALKDNGGYYDFDLFLKMNKRFPMLMYPIFRIQQQMRERVIGMERFRVIDQRSGDVYYQRRKGDRAPRYYLKKMKRTFFLYCCSWFSCCLPSDYEIQKDQERREELKRNQGRAREAREGHLSNVMQMEGEGEGIDADAEADVDGDGDGDDKEKKEKLKRKILKLKKIEKQKEKDKMKKKGNDNTEEKTHDELDLFSDKKEESDLSSLDEEDREELNLHFQLRDVVQRMKLINTDVVDEFDSDANTIIDEFEEFGFDEYRDARIEKWDRVGGEGHGHGHGHEDEEHGGHGHGEEDHGGGEGGHGEH